MRPGIISSDPSRRCEQFDLGDQGCWQAGEQVIQIIERTDPLSPATAKQGVNYRAAFGMD
jgi:hypothetical protein